MPASTFDCPAVLEGDFCDDGDDETMDDVCTSDGCHGKKKLSSSLTFDVSPTIPTGAELAALPGHTRKIAQRRATSREFETCGSSGKVPSLATLYMTVTWGSPAKGALPVNISTTVHPNDLSTRNRDR